MSYIKDAVRKELKLVDNEALTPEQNQQVADAYTQVLVFIDTLQLGGGFTPNAMLDVLLTELDIPHEYRTGEVVDKHDGDKWIDHNWIVIGQGLYDSDFLLAGETFAPVYNNRVVKTRMLLQGRPYDYQRGWHNDELLYMLNSVSVGNYLMSASYELLANLTSDEWLALLTNLTNLSDSELLNDFDISDQPKDMATVLALMLINAGYDTTHDVISDRFKQQYATRMPVMAYEDPKKITE